MTLYTTIYIHTENNLPRKHSPIPNPHLTTYRFSSRTINSLDHSIHNLVHRLKRLLQSESPSTSIPHISLNEPISPLASPIIYPTNGLIKKNSPRIQNKAHKPLIFKMNLPHNPMQHSLTRTIRSRRVRSHLHPTNTPKRASDADKNWPITLLKKRVYSLE